MSQENRISAACEEATMAFFAVVAEHFPELTSGDVSPDAALAWDDFISGHVRRYVQDNSPPPEVLRGYDRHAHIDIEDYVRHAGDSWCDSSLAGPAGQFTIDRDEEVTLRGDVRATYLGGVHHVGGSSHWFEVDDEQYVLDPIADVIDRWPRYGRREDNTPL